MILKSYILMLLSCFVITAVKAQTQLRENIFSQKLPNGLTVLVIEDNSVPLVTISMTFKNGSFTESPIYSGLTYMYHNMLFRANKDYGSSDMVAYYASKSGMIRNTSAAEEKAECHFTMPNIGVDEGLRYMNSAMRFPLLDEKSLAEAKGISNRELQVKETNSLFALGAAVDQHLWGNLYNRKRAIGNHASIQSATLSLMDSVQKRYYYPNNALLTIAGSISHEKIFTKVNELFASWQSSVFDPFKKWQVPLFKPIIKTQYFTVESATATVPYITLGWQGPNTQMDIQSTYTADVFSNIVMQNTSRLKKALLQSGLALEIDFNYLTLRRGGPITFMIKPNPLKIKECLAEAKRQINLFDSDDYITAQQIATAQRKLEIGQIRREEISSNFVNTLAFWWASASLNYYFTYLDNLQKINKADLQAYVRKYIKNKPYCAGLLISPELRSQLKTDDFFKAD
ncbi:MAG: insulinase family protein [Mucilaginibacter sp.]|uniref:M16 family metallopeptidase n=1 Tax=Mucilaginibacter sp. TaxID=1882438 RepID=UPI0026063B67|nr:pitrilysin family protein [Mucilaginibacter sp.]MDB5004997.1 insulinase family protein [Mucilaginibacter sp.]